MFDFNNNKKKKNKLEDIKSININTILLIIILLLLSSLILKLYKINNNYESFNNLNKKPTLAIHSVFILPENFIFLEEWIVYHLELGFSQFYFYDNYGSIGMYGSSLNKAKIGIEFNKIFNINNIYQKFETLKKKYPQITYIKWQPKNENNQIIYDPDKAIAHYRDNYSKNSDWSAFIDPDEFIILDNTNSNNLQDYILNKESNNITKILMKQKKFQDRFCNIDKYIFDIDNTIININVEGWAYKCLYKNTEMDPNIDGFFMHDIAMKPKGNTHLCELNELRFNHYNVSTTQINWMKDFLKKDTFEHGKDNSMKKFKYLVKKYNIPEHTYNQIYLNSIKKEICYTF